MPDQDDPGMSRVGADVPANVHEALYQWRMELNRDLPRGEKISQARIIREGIILRLAVAKAAGNLPSEAEDHVKDLDPNDILSQYGLTNTVACPGPEDRRQEVTP